MNNNLYLTSALILSMVFLFSCNEDDAGTRTENSIQLNGTSFSIASATILGVSLDGEGHAGLSLISNSGTLVKTLTIDFEYSPDEPLEGDYAFPQAAGSRLLDDWLTNYTITEITGSSSSSESEHLQEGTMTLVSNGGNNYSVFIDLIMDGGSVFKGTYTGVFTVVFNNA